MKKLGFFLIFLFLINESPGQNDKLMDMTIYQFKVKDIDGKVFDFKSLKEKK